jgi:Tol biopolymer transport system component
MRRVVVALSLVAASACALIVPLDDLGGGSDAGDASVDAPADVIATDASDGATDAGVSCDPTKPFTTFKPITELETAGNDDHMTLSPDELQIWYSSDRASDAGLRDIFHATRASRTAAFGAPAIVSELSTVRDDSQPSITADLLTIALATQVNGTQWDVFVSTRGDAGSPFGTLATVPPVNTGSTDWMPTFTSDRSVLYFVTNRSGNYDIWSWPYGSATPPAPVTELDTTGDEERPCPSADQLWMYWASSRSDLGTKGFLDVFVAHRASTSDPFGSLAQVKELESAQDDNPDWLSPDLCRIYVHSARTGGAGGDDLYVAERVP